MNKSTGSFALAFMLLGHLMSDSPTAFALPTTADNSNSDPSSIQDVLSLERENLAQAEQILLEFSQPFEPIPTLDQFIDALEQDSQPESARASLGHAQNIASSENEFSRKKLIDEILELNSDISTNSKELKDLYQGTVRLEEEVLMTQSKYKELELRTLELSNRTWFAKSQLRAIEAQSSDPTYAQKLKFDRTMPIAMVTSEEAILVADPREPNVVLDYVGRGARLYIETRFGGWYRIVTQRGKRAWISSGAVAFGPGNHIGPTNTISIRGFNPSA